MKYSRTYQMILSVHVEVEDADDFNEFEDNFQYELTCDLPKIHVMDVSLVEHEVVYESTDEEEQE